MKRHRARALALVAVRRARSRRCGGSAQRQQPARAAAAAARRDVSGSISIIGVWTGDEQKSFQAVLDGFKKKYPNVKVKYTLGRRQRCRRCSRPRSQGGNPPDLAAVVAARPDEGLRRRRAR